MTNFDWLALYGAALSTLIFVRDLLASRSTLKVSVSHGVDAQRHDGVCAVIRVSNYGDQPLMLSHVGLQWEYRSMTFRDHLRHILRYKRVNRRPGWIHGSLPPSPEGYNFPQLIDPKQSADFWIPFEAIDAEAEEKRNVIIASAQDALGRHSYSRPFKMRGIRILEEVD